ncbi:MAG: COX15/CtaA family protein [Rhizobiaceae bacterium]
MTVAEQSALPVALRAAEIRNRRLVRYWLYAVLVAIFALVLVGGATRLTDSGLSITEWKPIHGVIPPLSEADWQEEFAKYRQIPEYEQIKKGMSLAEFKVIFWWEWVHRLLARGVGFLFAVPLALFWLSGRLERRLKPRLLGILALGGLQGAIGWWMVASGLVDRVDVSQVRLATHLTLACMIFAAIMVVARGLAPHSEAAADDGTRHFAGFLVLAVLVQIYLGGLVAGLDAGMAYNTFPKMDGRWWPDGLLVIEPAWRNFFENPKTVQFVHRLFAFAVVILIWVHATKVMRDRGAGSVHARRARVLLGLVLLQATAGVVTLVNQVPVGWALVHQGMALVVLGFACAHWRGTKGAYAPETEVRLQS